MGKIRDNLPMVLITVNVKDGYCSSNNGNVFVILNTDLNEDLILKV